MRKIVLFLLIVFSLSCSKEKECDCSDLLGALALLEQPRGDYYYEGEVLNECTGENEAGIGLTQDEVSAQTNWELNLRQDGAPRPRICNLENRRLNL